MTSFWFAVAGAGVLVLLVYDLVRTTLSASGGGPLTNALGRAVWQASGRANWAGPVVLLCTAALWVGGLWLGWTLVFLALPDAAVSASTGTPVGVWERVYFAGYTVVTLGLGDVVPGGPLWRVLTVTSAASGLVLLTLGVTYYGAVLDAVVEKQQLAEQIGGLGDAPADMVLGAWDGTGAPGLDVLLAQIAGGIVRHNRYHYAYPVVHYFRHGDPSAALPVQFARLCDALTIWEQVARSAARPSPAVLRSVRSSADALIGTLGQRLPAAADVPPVPDLHALLEADLLATRAPAPFDAAFDTDVRRVLLGYVRGHRYDWTDVDPPH